MPYGLAICRAGLYLNRRLQREVGQHGPDNTSDCARLPNDQRSAAGAQDISCVKRSVPSWSLAEPNMSALQDSLYGTDYEVAVLFSGGYCA